MKTEHARAVKQAIPSSLFKKKIGNTVYAVSVAFNENARENIHDKILRLVVNDISKNKGMGEV
ncbi:MAG: transposon-encoded TnpW family protein [Oscillospiraceae bacterium]|nr:transposon-encoded TnpW family protein [Oscillospiraceae bacterium]